MARVPWLALFVVCASVATLALLQHHQRAAAIEAFESGYAPLELPGLLSAQECDRLAAWADGKWDRSTVLSPDGSTVSGARTSTQTWVHRGTAEAEAVRDITDKILHKATELTGVTDPELYESLQVARYEPGQEYRPHHDACVNDTKCGANGKVYRQATLLIYLTDDFEGGGTYFPNIDFTVVPQKGKAVLFFNVDPARREHPLSLHAGLPVTGGREPKIIANQWVRFVPRQ